MTAAAAAHDRSAFPYRMKDLAQRTGLSRQVIHFYIEQRLVPEGHKTGRNMAWYGEEHVERILLIRRLQHERFLPLKAIRAILSEQEGSFTAAQRAILREVKGRLARAGGGDVPRVDLHELLLRTGVPRSDVEEMERLGLLAVTRTGRGRKPQIAAGDAWMLELWGEMKAAGFSRDLGFTPRDMLLYEEAAADLFAKETALLKERLSSVPADKVGVMVERALPLITTFLSRAHDRLIQSFFASIQD